MTQTGLKANIGVVGLGRMGQRHALNILHHVPRARLFAVCSPAPHEIEWAKRDLEPEGVQVFDTFEAMIRTPGLEAVVIASPSELHFSQTLAAMELGIHVLCEKPVTRDLAQVREIHYLNDVVIKYFSLATRFDAKSRAVSAGKGHGWIRSPFR